MYHSVLLPYRGRPEHLHLSLTTLAAAEHREPLEVLLIDQASSSDTPAVIKPFESLNIRYHRVEDAGPFQKCRLLNLGLQESKGEIITTLDCDMLVHTMFLKAIEGFEFGDKCKLGHRVHLLDPSNSPVAAGLVESLPASRDSLHQFYQKIRAGRSPNIAGEEWLGLVTGNSQFSMARLTISELGGWDERFVGYGIEDVELNVRAAKAGVVATINEDAPLFHLWHKQNQRGWNDEALTRRNRELFELVQ